MAIEWWSFLIWFNKVIFYLVTVSAVGGLWMLYFLDWLKVMSRMLERYIAIAAFAGGISSLLLFFLQVGYLADQGVMGMFDPLFLSLLMTTVAAKAQLFIALCFSLLFIQHKFRSQARLAGLSLQALIPSGVFLILILLVYAQLGHSAEYAWWVQAILVLHLLAVSLWMGALFPLWKLTQLAELSELKISAAFFGKVALYIVIGLVLCGAALLYILLKNWEALVHTLYGNVLMFKLAWVSVLLALAAINKLFLTPRLDQEAMRLKLRWAIVLEMYLGLSILMLTAYLSTIVGLT